MNPLATHCVATGPFGNKTCCAPGTVEAQHVPTELASTISPATATFLQLMAGKVDDGLNSQSKEPLVTVDIVQDKEVSRPHQESEVNSGI
jgi:hypothetical protein